MRLGVSLPVSSARQSAPARASGKVTAKTKKRKSRGGDQTCDQDHAHTQVTDSKENFAPLAGRVPGELAQRGGRPKTQAVLVRVHSQTRGAGGGALGFCVCVCVFVRVCLFWCKMALWQQRIQSCCEGTPEPGEGGTKSGFMHRAKVSSPVCSTKRSMARAARKPATEQ